MVLMNTYIEMEREKEIGIQKGKERQRHREGRKWERETKREKKKKERDKDEISSVPCEYTWSVCRRVRRRSCRGTRRGMRARKGSGFQESRKQGFGVPGV